MNHTAPSPPSPARGRGLLASRPLRPGDIIAVFDNNNPSLSPSTTTTTTSIAIPDSNHLDETCSFCLSPSTTPTPTPPVIKLRACTACRAASYCSPACQKRDWQHVHKLECSVFKRVQTAAVAASAGNGTKTPVLPTPVRALVQILLLLQAPRSGQAAAAAALVGELQSHVEEFRKGQSAGGGGGGGRGREHGSDGGGSGSSGGGREKAETVSWQDMQLQAMAALHYLGRDEWEMNMAMEILCKLQVNSFNRLDADTGQTGLFLNSQLAMVNHSCLPNAYVQFSGRAAVLRASRAIEEGSEVDISYIDQALPLSQRQASLKARYHFLCACPRCAQNMDVYEACRQYPDLDANEASLATDIKDILPLQSKQPSSHNTTTANIQQRYHSSLPALPLQAADSEAATEQDLRRRWTLCQPLLTLQSQASTPTPPGMKIPWATHPLPEILTEAAIHLSSSSSSSPSSSSSSSSSRYASALSLCALQATHIEPVRSPFPNSPGRIKGLLMLVKLLAFTAAPSPSSLSASQSLSTAAAASAAAVEAPIRRVLDSMDIPTTCEVLLLFVLGSATSWQDQQETQRYLVQPYHREAQEMLEDIRSLPGRDSERASVQKLFQSYSRGESGSGSGTSGGAGDEENRLFLDMVIVKPLREIASFARDVMDAEFGSAVSSADAASGIS